MGKGLEAKIREKSVESDKRFRSIELSLNHLERLFGTIPRGEGRRGNFQEERLKDEGNPREADLFVEMPMSSLFSCESSNGSNFRNDLLEEAVDNNTLVTPNLGNLDSAAELLLRSGCPPLEAMMIFIPDEVLTLYKSLFFGSGGIHYVGRVVVNGLVNTFIFGIVEEVSCEMSFWTIGCHNSCGLLIKFGNIILVYNTLDDWKMAEIADCLGFDGYNQIKKKDDGKESQSHIFSERLSNVHMSVIGGLVGNGGVGGVKEIDELESMPPEKKMEKNLVVCLFAFVAFVSSQQLSTIFIDETIFYESFDEALEERRIISENGEYQDRWRHSKSKGHEDYVFLVSEKAKRYTKVKEIDKAVTLKDKDVVFQSETRLQNGLVSEGIDALVIVWDLKNCEKVREFKVHKLQVTGVALDGEDILSISVDCTLRRWRNGEFVESWEAHKSAIQTIIRLSSGELARSSDTTLKLCKGKTCLHTFVGHIDTLRGLAVMSDLGILLASHDGFFRMWALSGERLNEMVVHTYIFYSVDSHVSGLITSGSEDRFAKIWRDENCVQSIEHPGCVWDDKFLEKGDIVIVYSDAVAHVWTACQIACRFHRTQVELSLSVHCHLWKLTNIFLVATSPTPRQFQLCNLAEDLFKKFSDSHLETRLLLRGRECDELEEACAMQKSS